MKIDVGEVLATRDELLRTKTHLLGSLSDAKMAADSVKKSSALAGQAKKAVEAVDECVGKVIELVESKQGNILITADHGNAEQMIDYKTGEPHTAHTTNTVPLILVGMDNVELKEGKLADLAPTMLDIMGLSKPEEMTGQSLIIIK